MPTFTGVMRDSRLLQRAADMILLVAAETALAIRDDRYRAMS